MDMEGLLPISISYLALLISAFFSLSRMPQPAHGRHEAAAAARASRIYWQTVDQMVACALVLTALLATYIYH